MKDEGNGNNQDQERVKGFSVSLTMVTKESEIDELNDNFNNIKDCLNGLHPFHALDIIAHTLADFFKRYPHAGVGLKTGYVDLKEHKIN